MSKFNKIKNGLKNHNLRLPKEGIKGFTKHFKNDFRAGFVAFLLALPLSIGIAKASDFPPTMGILTAIVGGVVVSFFSGSKLTIKGPAAGLIAICLSAIADLGNGDQLLGWKLLSGVLFISGILQVLFGIFKLGKFVNFFPTATVKGMMTAIGIVIFLKQLPVLLNVPPELYKGLSVFETLVNIKSIALSFDPLMTSIGLGLLAILLIWTYLKNVIFKTIPSAFIVVFFSIGISLVFNLESFRPSYSFLEIGDFLSSINFQLTFEGASSTLIFIKYIIIFSLVGSIESLLTIKATDDLDPYKRLSNTNKDLMAVGFGNALVAIVGGIPMIAEVARTTANINAGAKTRWANFHHGLLLLIFVLLAIPILERIPNTAFAALLIAVGLKLAAPKEFIKMYKIGKEQLVVFVTTIIFAVFTDLLTGILMGVIVNIIYEVYYGCNPLTMFKKNFKVEQKSGICIITFFDSAVFSNYRYLSTEIKNSPKKSTIKIDFSNAKVVDFSTLSSLKLLSHDIELNGGKIEINGLEHHIPKSKHPEAIRVKQ